jgi:uncharacterized protein (TIGR02231 family)
MIAFTPHPPIRARSVSHRTELVVFALVGLLLAAAQTGLAHAASVAAGDARIVEVTVFRDRAEVIREASVALAVGPSSVEFTGIPFGVETDSLRVSADGIPATLGAVELSDRAEEPIETDEWLAAREEVRRLEDKIAALRAANDVDKELRSFLASIRAVAASNESAKVGEGRADPETIAGVYEILQIELQELATSGLERQRQREDLQQRLELARARLGTLRPGPGIRSRVAMVEIEARKAGSLTLRLAYVAPGASWRPTYRASLDAGTGDVNLVAEGVVRQGTGEDWSGVALRLSTASPTQGVEPPMLTAWTLRPLDPVYETDKELAMQEAVPARHYQNVLGMAPGAAGAPAEPAEMIEADVVRSAYNVAFEVPGGSDVPADGRDHRVVLRSESLAGRLVYRTVPALAPRAYLTSVTTSPAGYPLLAGPVRVFAGGAYLGSFPLEEKGPGVELTVPFGVDNRIEIVRLPMPRSAGRGGLTGKQREVEYAFRTQIQNLQSRSVTLILEDRVPVAEDERIVVQLGKETTPGYRDSERRPGVKLWTLELDPGEKREIVLAYSVRYPKEMLLPGLE